MKPRLYKRTVSLLPALPVSLISVPSFLRAFGITAQIIFLNKVHDIIADTGEQCQTGINRNGKEIGLEIKIKMFRDKNQNITVSNSHCIVV